MNVYTAGLLPPDTSRFEPEYQPIIERLRREHPRVTADEGSRAEATPARLGIVRDRIVAEEKRALIFGGVFATCFFWLCTALVAMLSAAVAWGGLLLSAFGICVVRNDGARAGRGRCFVRALISWLPVVVGTVGGTAFVFWIDIVRRFDSTRPGHRALAAGAVMAALAIAGVFVGGAVRAALRPERGWQDQLVGTYLVPK